MNKIHILKILPFNFDAVVSDKMTFQLRKNDREFGVGDTVLLQEYSEEGGYSGREQVAIINYIESGSGVRGGYIILNIEKLSLAIVGGEKYRTNV